MCIFFSETFDIYIPQSTKYYYMSDESDISFDGVTDQANTMWQQSPDFLQWQLELSDTILHLDNRLKGRFWDPNEKKFIYKKGSELMNELGANNCTAIVQSKLSKNIILSNLTEESVLRIAKECRQNVARLIFLRYSDFEMRKANFDTVVQAIDHQVFCTLRRAYNQGERIYLGKTQSRVERITREKEGKGLGSWVPIFGGKK